MAPQSPTTPGIPLQVEVRPQSEDEIFAMLHTDPGAFVDMVSAQAPRRGPLVEIFPVGSRPPSSVSSNSPTPTVVPAHPSGPSMSEALAGQLVRVPGSAGAGIVLADPSGSEIFEVRWLPGYQLPPLPQVVDGRPVRVVIMEAVEQLPYEAADPRTAAQMQYEAADPRAAAQTVAQMQYEAADQMRAMEPGSPIPGVPDDAWRQFVALLARESPSFSSSRHIGQYRQRRERLAEFGVEPQTIHGSAAAQRQALDTDLSDAYRHAAAGGVLAEHLGRPIVIPGRDGAAPLTLSGVLGVIQCAGLDGAVGWLEQPNDRKRYPHTTQSFLRTNGVF